MVVDMVVLEERFLRVVGVVMIFLEVVVVLEVVAVDRKGSSLGVVDRLWSDTCTTYFQLRFLLQCLLNDE